MVRGHARPGCAMAAGGLLPGLMLASALAAPAPPARLPPVPTKAVPCVTFADDAGRSIEDVELVTDGNALAVCWPNGACHDGSTPVPRPAPPPARVAARVEPTRVCTGATCDPLGPRTRAAIASVAPGLLRATSDHAIIVIDHDGDDPLWSRAADRRIALPAQHRRGDTREGDVAAIELVGSHVMVSRTWRPDFTPPPPWLPARGTILDARGHITAVIPSAASGRTGGTSIVDLGDDELVVFDAAGGFSLVVRGTALAYGDLSDWHAIPTASRSRSSTDVSPGLMARNHEIHVQAFALDPGPNASGETPNLDGRSPGTFHTKRFGYQWCDIDREGCHVGEIEIGFQIDRDGRSHWLRQLYDRVLPTC